MLKTIKTQDEIGEIELILDEENLNDFEVIDMLAGLKGLSEASGDKEKMEALMIWPRFIERVFGKTQKEKIYDHFRDPETGRVPVDKVTEFVSAVLTENAKKN